jgi:hypothetical protein
MDTKLSVLIMLFMVGIMLAVFTATNYSPNLLPNANATGADNPFTYSTNTGTVVLVSGVLTNASSNCGITCTLSNYASQLGHNIQWLQCQTLNFGNPNVNSICNVNNPPNTLADTSPFNLGATTIGTNGIFFSITSNPLETAGAIAAIFIGLGVLAGVLGAGSLANIMAAVGLALSVNAYFALEELQFNGMPLPAVLIFNGFIGIVSIWLIWTAFDGGSNK